MLRTRLESMDAAEKKAKDGSSNDMDLSTSVSGKRTRDLEEPMPTEPTAEGNNEKRPRWGVLEIALKVDLDAVRKHTQW